MKTMQRASALAALAAVVLAGCGGEQAEERAPVARPVKTMVVGAEAAGERTYPGTTQAADRVELSFRVGGPLIELPIKEGQKVNKGHILARIDPRDYQIALDKAKAEFNKAEADLARYKRLYEQDAVPLSDLELRQAQRDVAKSQRDDARANLSDTYLRAPFAGEIGERYVDNREDVRPKQPVLSLHGVDVVEIVIDVPEAGRALFVSADLLRDVAMTATFDFAAGREFDLTLKEFASQADPRTRTYKATFTMPQPEGISVRPGMTANVRLVVRGDDAPGASRLVVPAHAVFAGDDGTQYVWVVADELTVHRREVTVGAVTGTSGIEIEGGLAGGERIAVSGVTQLREGMKIRLMEE